MNTDNDYSPMSSTMPNTNHESMTNKFWLKKIFKTKNIIVAFIVVVTIGFVYTLSSKSSAPLTTNQTSDLAVLTEEQTIITEPSQQDLEVADLPVINEQIQPLTENKANLMITSPQQNYHVGDNVEATVLINTLIAPDGIEFKISYDPQSLGQISVQTINSFGSYLSNKIDPESGIITAVLIKGPNEIIDLASPHPLLKISAQAKQAGTTYFKFDREKTGVAAAGGQAVLQDVYDLIINIE